MPEPRRPEIELPPIPERKVERERPPAPEVEKKLPTAPPPMPPKEAGAPPPTVAAPLKSPTLQRIENILTEGLEPIYAKMPPEQQQVFREKGEETASKIEQFMRTVRIQAKRILELIKGWLKLIPGVNKFFLEQEAKIKTDKIVAMAEEEKGKGL